MASQVSSLIARGLTVQFVRPFIAWVDICCLALLLVHALAQADLEMPQPSRKRAGDATEMLFVRCMCGSAGPVSW